MGFIWSCGGRLVTMMWQAQEKSTPWQNRNWNRAWVLADIKLLKPPRDVPPSKLSVLRIEALFGEHIKSDTFHW